MGAIVFFDVLMTSVYLYCILYYKAAVFNNVLLYLLMCFECLFLCCGEQILSCSKSWDASIMFWETCLSFRLWGSNEIRLQLLVDCCNFSHSQTMYNSCIDQLVFLLQWWFCCSAAVSQFNFAKVQYLSFLRGGFISFLFGWIAVTSLAF